MTAYQALRLKLVCRPVLTAVIVVVLGAATRATALLPPGAAAARTTGTTTSDSALFAPRSSPIWREAGRRRKPCRRSRGSAERLGWSILPERICEKNF